MYSTIQWPQQKKMAVILSFDVDSETGFASDPHNKYRPSALSMGTYGRRVGLTRILRLLKQYDVPSDFFVPGATAALDPTVVERIVESGNPIGHHGYLHKRLDTLSLEEEEAELVKGIEIIQKYAGYKPTGFRAPLWEMHSRTPQLLKKYGFTFDSSLQADDVPYTIDAGNGDRLLEVPGTWLLDDWEQFSFAADWTMPYQIEEPDKVYRLWKTEFDGLYEEGRCFTLTMHPELIGRTSRIRLLERLIQYIKGQPNVWFTTAHEVAQCWVNKEIEFDHIPNVDTDILYPEKSIVQQ